MLRNFFKTAYRNIIKYKAYSIINFIGLTSGLTLSLLVIVYVRSETGYDRFNEKLDRLYRLSYTTPNGLHLASTPPPIAPVLKDYFPQIEETARIYGRNVSIARTGKPEVFEETDILFADSSATRLFTFDFIAGDLSHALRDKFTVILNQEMAKKYFGDDDPIGESLTFAGKHQFKVIAVVKNFPEQSHIRFNMLVPYDNMFDLEADAVAATLRSNLAINFIISHSYTYALLKDGAQITDVNKGMESFLKKYAKPSLLVGQIFAFMPVSKIHLESELGAEPSATNSWTNLFIFIGVGILTLIIACINYINLSTAQSFARIKEIGIRKIMGSMRHQLILQFLAESFLFCVVSLLIAFGAFNLTLPYLSQLTDTHLTFREVVDFNLIVGSVVLLGAITLMAGGYPAYFITKFESVAALKSSGLPGSADQFLRKGLVVFQLAIACMLVSGSLLIIRQMDYLESRPLGFQREQIITIPLYSQSLNNIFSQSDSTFRSRIQTFRNSVESHTGVKQTTLSSAAPGLGATFRGAVPEGFTQQDNLFIASMAVDYDFLHAYGMELVAGRSFDRDHRTDDEAYIINETAIKEFKWESATKSLGKSLEQDGKHGRIIGVVKDFNFTSLTSPMSAMVLQLDADQFNILSIKFDNANVSEIIKEVEADWNKIFPQKAFEFTFLDEQLNSQYSNFQNFGIIIESFTGIAILISCLGVYGLVLFTVQRKVKEIGVRKVLGAGLRNILYIIYKDFAILILIGFAIAIPGSYFFMQRWLTNFIYHTDIDAATFIISLASVFMIVSLTISYQAFRAAGANPVKSLRSE